VACPGRAACLPSVCLAVEGLDVVAPRVQVLAAAQAPGAAHRLAAVAADPEPGRVVSAVDAQLDGVRQPARRGHGAPPTVRGGGAGPVLAGRHGGGRRHVRDEPCGKAAAAWSAPRGRPVAVELAWLGLACAWRAGPTGQDLAEGGEVHGGLLRGLGSWRAGEYGGCPALACRAGPAVPERRAAQAVACLLGQGGGRDGQYRAVGVGRAVAAGPAAPHPPQAAAPPGADD